jgi:bacterioferritin (cytochrome b1)
LKAGVALARAFKLCHPARLTSPATAKMTAFIFREILEDEEEHHDLFTSMLEEV